jgi:small-conductance mechanosensitive channel
MAEETQGAEAQGAEVEAGAVEATTGQDDGNQTAAELEAARAHIAKLEADNKKARDKKREAQAALEERQRKAGEFEEILKAREQRIAELEALVPDAEAWRDYSSKQAERIAEMAQGLSEQDRVILDGISDLNAKRAFIERVSAVEKPSKSTAPSAPPAPASVAGNGVPDFGGLVGDEKIRAIKEHPAEYAKYLGSKSPARARTIFER